MITIIHGDDLISSRNYYYSHKQKFADIKYLDGEKINFDEFFQATQNQSIFDDITVFVESFFTKNKSADYKKIISYLNLLKNTNIVFYETSEISKVTLNQVKKADIKNFPVPKNIFLFLDNLRPGNGKSLVEIYKSLRKETADEIIYFMLIRQFRLMIGLNTNIEEAKRLAPWQISKLEKQSSYFKNLVRTYAKIFEADLNMKTGKFPFSYETSIDFLLLDL